MSSSEDINCREEEPGLDLQDLIRATEDIENRETQESVGVENNGDATNRNGPPDSYYHHVRREEGYVPSHVGFEEIKRDWIEGERPSEVTDAHALLHSRRDVEALCPYVHWTKIGKWTMFFPNGELDQEWMKAVELYDGRELTGVRSMKVSTDLVNPRGSKPLQAGVIIFYCGPYYQEERMMAIGFNLINLMGFYESPNNRWDVTFKTNMQSMAGTRATGQRGNKMFSISRRQYSDWILYNRA